jgi:lipopolysaccharide export LptBFGC system permease protein LptF
MDERIYIGISLVVLIVIAALVIVVNRKLGNRRLTPLGGVAFAFVLAGIAFGADRLVGYGLMSIGVVFAIIDIVRNLRQK